MIPQEVIHVMEVEWAKYESALKNVQSDADIYCILLDIQNEFWDCIPADYVFQVQDIFHEQLGGMCTVGPETTRKLIAAMFLNTKQTFKELSKA